MQIMHTKKPPVMRADGCLPARSSLHQALGRLMVVVLQSVLVARNLTIELVDQVIDCGIKVGVRTLGKHVVALDVDIAFGALPSLLFLQFLDGEQHFDIDNLVKVPGDSIKLGRYVIAQGWGYFEVMTADRQVHGFPPVSLAVESRAHF
jgi:hypothetical protein